MLNFKIDWNIQQKNITFLALILAVLLFTSTVPVEARSETDKGKKFKKSKLKKKNSKIVAQQTDCAGGDSYTKGCWNPVFTLPVIGVHMSVLPNKKVIIWDNRGIVNNAGVTTNAQGTNAQIWDPADPIKPNPSPDEGLATSVPYSLENQKCNVFCSGHSFLPDGRLLVSGGIDGGAFGAGIKEAALFDFSNNQWTQLPAKMNNGRWYPTNLTLGNGDTLVWAGTYRPDPSQNPYLINNVPQVLQKQFDGSFAWRSLNIKNPEITSIYYSWLYLLSSGKVFAIDDPYLKSYIVSIGEKFKYPKDFLYRYPYDPNLTPYFKQPTDPHHAGSSVVYDKDKILVVGGAIDPKYTAEVIDFTNSSPAWKRVGRLITERRHLNATLLPDGKVFVNGGNKGPGFNHNCVASYVKQAEMWNPANEGASDQDGAWSAMASATQPRLYHSAAVLLPDGRVLTGGTTQEPIQDKNCSEEITHNFTYEIFSPPYLFNSDGTRRTVRPTIGNGPMQVKYGETVQYGFSNSSSISMVRIIRLPSVTHSFNQNQGVVTRTPIVTGQNFQITIPVNRNECPPGHYMMFILDSAGIPSEAKIIQVVEN